MKDKFLKEVENLPCMDLITLIEAFHSLKFPTTDAFKQERKLYSEIAEFQTATTTEEKVEEAIDIIISAIGYIERCEGYSVREELIKKFSKVLERPYIDEFQHKEEEDDNIQD